jgi:hypothetical protein
MAGEGGIGIRATRAQLRAHYGLKLIEGALVDPLRHTHRVLGDRA